MHRGTGATTVSCGTLAQRHGIDNRTLGQYQYDESPSSLGQ